MCLLAKTIQSCQSHIYLILACKRINVSLGYSVETYLFTLNSLCGTIYLILIIKLTMYLKQILLPIRRWRESPRNNVLTICFTDMKVNSHLHLPKLTSSIK